MRNIGIYIGVFLIQVYRIMIRPFIWSSCRYEPSCSEYTRQAIIKYGFGKGVRLGAKRIARCNPFSKHEPYDPLE